jgi:hypothetical protein
VLAKAALLNGHEFDPPTVSRRGRATGFGRLRKPYARFTRIVAASASTVGVAPPSSLIVDPVIKSLRGLAMK